MAKEPALLEVVETRGHIEDGRVALWRVPVKRGATLNDRACRGLRAVAARMATHSLVAALTVRVKPSHQIQMVFDHLVHHVINLLAAGNSAGRVV